MRDIYKKFGFYKPVLTLDSQYTDVPSGDIDVERLLAGKPAFLDMAAESEILKKRKLVLGNFSGLIKENTQELSYRMMRLKCIAMLREAIRDGFEVYQYRYGEMIKLDALSVSKVFIDGQIGKEEDGKVCIYFDDDKFEDYQAEKSDGELKQQLMIERGLAYDDVEVMSLERLVEFGGCQVRKFEVLSCDFVDEKRCDNPMISRVVEIDFNNPFQNDQVPLYARYSKICEAKKSDIEFNAKSLLVLNVDSRIPIVGNDFEDLLYAASNLRQIELSYEGVNSQLLAVLAETDAQQYVANLETLILTKVADFEYVVRAIQELPFLKQIQHELSILDFSKNKITDLSCYRRLLTGALKLKTLVFDTPEQIDIFFELLDQNKVNLTKLKKIEFGCDYSLTLEQAGLFLRRATPFDLFNPTAESLVSNFYEENRQQVIRIEGHNLVDNDLDVLSEKSAQAFKSLIIAITSNSEGKKTSVSRLRNLIDRMNRLEKIEFECCPNELDNLAEFKLFIEELKSRQVKIDDESKPIKVVLKNVDDLQATLQNEFAYSDYAGFNAAGNISEVTENSDGIIFQGQEVVRASRQLQFLDANTTLENVQFNMDRIFFSLEQSVPHPSLTNYRLEIFQRVALNLDNCARSNAFFLQKNEGLLLRSCSVEIGQQSAYTRALGLKEESPKKEYYFAAKKLMLTTDWQALPSLKANEIIHYLRVNPGVAVELAFSERDGLYYIKAMQNASLVQVEYCIETPPISGVFSSAVQKIIHFCRTFGVGALAIPAGHLTGSDYLNALIEQKVGACRHRSLVFKAVCDDVRLQQKIFGEALNLSGVEVRIINNDCHSFVEVREGGGAWMQCDLGGYPAKLNIDDSADPLKNRENLQRAIAEHIPVLIPRMPPKDYFPAPQKNQVTQPKAYVQHLIAAAECKRLIQCMPEQLPGFCHLLQQVSQDTQKAFHYIHDAADLILNRPHIVLKDDNTGTIQAGYSGAVYRFLNETHDARVLIVNFANFTGSELARFNTLLDENPSIDGVPLPVGTKVIGLVDQTKEADASLYSRFRGAVEKCPIDVKELSVEAVFVEKSSDNPSFCIEFYGALNWRAKLLGYWSLQENSMVYVKGELVALLESKKSLSEILLSNPPLHDPEFTRFFREANLRGYIEYEGRRLPWSNPFLSIRQELNFSVESIAEVRRGFPARDVNIINPAVFNSFFKRYEVVGNGLVEQVGLIDSLARSTQSISIFVSEKLSDAQWMQLLDECKTKNLTLNITLGSHVDVPEALAAKVKVDEGAAVAFSRARAKCVVADDPDLYISQLVKKDTVFIDVSELNSSDLLIKTMGGLTDNQLLFSQKEGALISALRAGKKVILHGQFSAEMRQHLQVFLFHESKAEDIIIVTNDKTAVSFELFSDVVFHENKLSVDYVHDRARLRNPRGFMGLSEDLPRYVLSREKDLTIHAAKHFHGDRLAAVENILSQSPFVFLAGLTGVGKTTFVESIWKNADRRLFVGIDQIKAWANDRSPGQKALFIDEANITGKNWSQFEGLFTNDPPGMMIGSEFIELTPDHKVIFAGNPVKYSDDRKLPSLFARHGNSVVFEPLSAACLYQDVLLPILGEDNSRARQIAEPILNIYLYLNTISRTEVLLTPRELKMMAQLALKSADPVAFAKYYAYQLAIPFVPKENFKEFDEHFKVAKPVKLDINLRPDSRLILTGSNRPTAEMILDFLKLSQAKQGPAGLGGLLIEGEPGLGKSELVIDCLRAQGFEKRALDAKEPATVGQKYFYYLPSGALPSKQKEILLKAFHEGVPVVWDEFNTAASHEGLLNRLLMGQGPNGESPQQSGFILIGTQNPTTMAGRTKTSTALLHRMHYHVMQPYSEVEMKAMLGSMGLPGVRVDALVSQYLKKKPHNSALCFRDVVYAARDDLRGLFCGKESPTQSDLLAMLQDFNLNPDQLEAIYLHKLCDDDVRRVLVFHPQMDQALSDKIFSVFDVKKAIGEIAIDQFDQLRMFLKRVSDIQVFSALIERWNTLQQQRCSSAFFKSGDLVPSVVLTAVLSIVQQKYQGVDGVELEALIKRCNNKSSVEVINEIRNLIDSGRVGRAEEVNRLRPVLSIFLSGVQINQKVDLESITRSCVLKKDPGEKSACVLQ